MKLAYGFAAGWIVHDDDPDLVDITLLKTRRSSSMVP
jgi:hypothetical protein